MSLNLPSRAGSIRGLCEATIDTKAPGEGDLQLSNFSIHEDRVTGEIVMDMTRYFTVAVGQSRGDSYTYRIEP